MHKNFTFKMDSKISLIIICVLFVFVLIAELLLSVGSSQLDNDITDLNDDASDALFESTTTSTQINNVLSKTQNLTSTPQNSRLSGNVAVSTEVTVAGKKTYSSLKAIEQEISSSLTEQNPLVLETVSAKKVSISYLLYKKPLYTALAIFPGFILNTENGDTQTNSKFTLKNTYPITGTLGDVGFYKKNDDSSDEYFPVPGESPDKKWTALKDHGYLLNANFKIAIYAEKDYKDFQGQFCNLTNQPLCFLMPNGYNKAERCRSILVYYGTKLFNPYNSSSIPEDRLTAEWTDSTFPPIQDLY